MAIAFSIRSDCSSMTQISGEILVHNYCTLFRDLFEHKISCAVSNVISCA